MGNKNSHYIHRYIYCDNLFCNRKNKKLSNTVKNLVLPSNNIVMVFQRCDWNLVYLVRIVTIVTLKIHDSFRCRKNVHTWQNRCHRTGCSNNRIPAVAISWPKVGELGYWLNWRTVISINMPEETTQILILTEFKKGEFCKQLYIFHDRCPKINNLWLLFTRRNY